MPAAVVGVDMLISTSPTVTVDGSLRGSIGNAVRRAIANAATSYTNVGEAITSGYEAFASAAVTDRLRLRTDYTYTKVIDAITELELLRRPRHKYTLAAEWNLTDRLLLSATWLRVSTWIDGNRDFSIQRLTAPGYAVLNLAANYTVNEYTTVFGRIDNLLNERYQSPTGFDRPGLGVFGGIRVANR